MKIGIDIDEVVVEWARGYLDFYNRLNGGCFKREDIKSYNLWELLGVSPEEAFAVADKYYDSPDFDRVSMIEGAAESIKKLYQQGHKIYFITSRPARIKEKTITFLKKYFPDICFEVYFSGEHFKGQGGTKADICNELRVDVMIEDILAYERN